MSSGTTSRSPTGDNVVVRLRRGIQQAKAAGFEVRMEHLGDGEAGWCQIGSKRILFLDAAQTAQDQLEELGEALANFRRAA
ncbi:hypothetical protein LF1_46010 [Rubripirellula obstinata]|uniref:Uncharacterized protein n=1 Tax=Rubripirellula obstinata TaxID=406547 RepID=A0A5B1CQX1_9BACT|nr:hypothetical protein [Rubripirellula obstinata]KAA1262040.1 hypothetical protein LF1_46010 [Rubripirellula obstinata]